MNVETKQCVRQLLQAQQEEQRQRETQGLLKQSCWDAGYPYTAKVSTVTDPHLELNLTNTISPCAQVERTFRHLIVQLVFFDLQLSEFPRSSTLCALPLLCLLFSILKDNHCVTTNHLKQWWHWDGAVQSLSRVADLSKDCHPETHSLWVIRGLCLQALLDSVIRYNSG